MSWATVLCVRKGLQPPPPTYPTKQGQSEPAPTHQHNLQGGWYLHWKTLLCYKRKCGVVGRMGRYVDFLMLTIVVMETTRANNNLKNLHSTLMKTIAKSSTISANIVGWFQLLFCFLQHIVRRKMDWMYFMHLFNPFLLFESIAFQRREKERENETETWTWSRWSR